MQNVNTPEPNTIRGVLTNCSFETKYDEDGISYKDYLLYINNHKYTAKVKGQIYLEQGMEVLLKLKPGSAEVIDGYCIKEGYSWGNKPKDLKKNISKSDKYEFLEGTIVEKRKSTTGSIYMNRSAISNRGSRISYTIVLDKGEFHASRDEGEYLQLGMNVALVLNKKSPVLILEKASGNIMGDTKATFILFLLAIIIFNGYMYYIHTKPFRNFNVALIVINIFLLLAFILSVVTFRETQFAKRFLLSRVNES